MNFSTPIAFLLLFTLPFFWWLGTPNKPISRTRWRGSISLILRFLIMLLLIFALTGSQIARQSDNLGVVFLLDVSDSITPDQLETAEQFIRDSIAQMKATDQAAVILFGANALVERPMSGLAELAPITSIPQTLQTNLADAIQLAIALFPSGTARRIVLLTDGTATVGDSKAAAQLAAQSGVEISYLPLSRPQTTVEAMLVDVQAPTRVTQGEFFNVSATIHSNQIMPATIRLISNGQIIAESSIQLNKGINKELLRLQATSPDFTRYTIQLIPESDTFFQNNELAAFTEVAGPPRILVVANDGTLDDNGIPIPPETAQLVEALTATGLDITLTTPQELPLTVEDLLNYASVVLVNVNAKYLTNRKMETLQSYVRDLGGGLVVIGGPQSYGMGGYFETPLEETLPVSMQIKDEERFPSVSIAIVIDRSGSMGAQEGGLTKIQLAAEGAVRVVKLLNDSDQISVIPVDTEPHNQIGPSLASDRENIIAQIRKIGAGGGGIYVFTGLKAAAQALGESNNPVKHIIVLADGSDSEEKEGVPALIKQLTAEDVTISMVSIGDGPDVPWLREMAALGNGRFHFTDRAANLPQIFTQETTQIQRSYLIEEEFYPLLGTARSNPIISGITSVPPLYGYVGTSIKETAQLILQTPKEDPLLAAWQYGLGRSVAWSSDATGRWSSEWVRWQQFPTFWAKTINWTISEDRDSLIESEIDLVGNEAHIVVNSKQANGRFINNLIVESNIVDPSGKTTTLFLHQTAPGRYESSFTPTDEGAYFIRIAGQTADESLTIGQTTGWVLGYSPEYQQLSDNHLLLEQIALLTNGKDMTDLPEATFLHNLPPPNKTTLPIWHWLVLTALILLPFDIAVRRLLISKKDWEKLATFLFARFRRQKTTVVHQQTEQVARLFQAKNRAKTNSSSSIQPEENKQPVSPTPTIRKEATKPTPSPKEESTTSSHLAGRLRKKRDQKND